jgi:dihydrofolate reductase
MMFWTAVPIMQKSFHARHEDAQAEDSWLRRERENSSGSKMISLIWAMSENRVIGKDGKLPWNIPEDLKRFRKLTMGQIVVMGRTTYESIGKALDGRVNIILTSDPKYKADDCVVVNSLEEALRLMEGHNTFVIGGASIYKQFLPFADYIHMTLVHSRVEGDTKFPEIDWWNWKEVSRENHPTDGYSFFEFLRTTY